MGDIELTVDQPIVDITEDAESIISVEVTDEAALQITMLGGESPIIPGTATQYWTGLKAWAELEKEAVAGLLLTDSPQFAGMTLTGALNALSVNVNTSLQLSRTAGHGVIYDAAGDLWLRSADDAFLHLQPYGKGDVTFFASNEYAADNGLIYINVFKTGWAHCSNLQIKGDRTTGELRFTVNDDAHGNYISALVWGLPEATSLWAIKNAALDTTFFSVDGAGLVAASVSVNTPKLYNSAGDLKIQPDVQGDVDFFSDTDVADAANGKILQIWRKAAEGDIGLQIYIDQFQQARISTHALVLSSGTGNMQISASAGSLYLQGLTAAAGDIYLFSSSSGNRYLRIRGYITAVTAVKYVSLAVLDTDDMFHIARQDANILGLSVDMPLKVTGDAELDGALNHDGATAGFYGTAPIAQAVLATGAGATVDNVITALQNLGLVKQA